MNLLFAYDMAGALSLDALDGALLRLAWSRFASTQGVGVFAPLREAQPRHLAQFE